MSSGTVTIKSLNYDGSLRRSWGCRLVEQIGTKLIFEGVFESDFDHPELGFIRRGTVSHEFYWLDRWFNIFRVHEPEGTLRNYYCNINMPPRLENGVLEYVDLDIDIVLWPDGRLVVLDREEFEENAARFDYPDDVKAMTEATVADLTALIKRGAFPPD